MQGIHGRLGDLGAIDAQYDAAVSNAASALDYIVVGTVADGQAAVQFLRERNLGVASCLILEKQRHFERDMATGGAQPEGCPRLFDLIKCDDAAHRTAFFFAVRNTLVCADMAQARRLAYQGRQSRRVVTLAVRHPSLAPAVTCGQLLKADGRRGVRGYRDSSSPRTAP